MLLTCSISPGGIQQSYQTNPGLKHLNFLIDLFQPTLKLANEWCTPYAI